MESERPDALFRDPYARKLAGEHGERIVASMRRGRAMAWPMIVRTAVLDELILRAIERDGVDTVLNLAAGLDTRPYRLPLPSSLRWVEADFPDVIAYKREQLTGERPVCAVEHVGIDLTDVGRRRALFGRIGAAARQVLVVTEGLLVYLTPQQVAALAADLAAPPSLRWWLMDLASPRLLKMLAKTWGRAVAAGSAPFQFAPAEGSRLDRKSTRLNSSHLVISYAVFCLKKKKLKSSARQRSSVAPVSANRPANRDRQLLLSGAEYDNRLGRQCSCCSHLTSRRAVRLACQ